MVGGGSIALYLCCSIIMQVLVLECMKELLMLKILLEWSQDLSHVH